MTRFKKHPAPNENDPVLDDLDGDFNPIYTTQMDKQEVEERFGWWRAWVFPLIGVLGALLGPWLLIGLLWVLLWLFS